MTAPPAQHDRIIGGWLARLERVEQELYMAHLQQKLWTELRDEIQERAPQSDGTFLVAYTRLYVQSQGALIRRLCDQDSASHSLVSLIDKIRRNPAVLTREWYVARCALHGSSFSAAEVAAEWERCFGDPSEPALLNLALLDEDLRLLEQELGHIVTWVDKTIAHLDPSEPERVPLCRELREGLSVLAEVCGRYVLLLHQSAMQDWTPFPQGDWQAPFRPALFAPKPSVFDVGPHGGFT